MHPATIVELPSTPAHTWEGGTRDVELTQSLRPDCEILRPERVRGIRMTSVVFGI